MDLIQEQRELEISMANRGIDRYRRMADEAAQKGEAMRQELVRYIYGGLLDTLREAEWSARFEGAAQTQHVLSGAVKALSSLMKDGE